MANNGEMNTSHFSTNKLCKLVNKALGGVEDRIETLKPVRSLALFEKPSDRLFNKYDRLPPQSFFSEEVAESLFEGLRKGLNEVSACAWARIPQHVVHKWLALGHAGHERYQEFLLDWEHAMAKCQIDHLDMMENADPGVKANLVLTKGRVGKHWKDVKQSTLVIEDKRPQFQDLTDEEKAAKMRVLLYGNQPEQRMIVEAKVIEDDNA